MFLLYFYLVLFLDVIVIFNSQLSLKYNECMNLRYQLLNIKYIYNLEHFSDIVQLNPVIVLLTS